MPGCGATTSEGCPPALVARGDRMSNARQHTREGGMEKTQRQEIARQHGRAVNKRQWKVKERQRKGGPVSGLFPQHVEAFNHEVGEVVRVPERTADGGRWMGWRRQRQQRAAPAFTQTAHSTLGTKHSRANTR